MSSVWSGRWVASAAGPKTVTAGLLLATLLAAHGALWLASAVFEPLHAQTIDRLFRLRAKIAALAPQYDRTVFVVPIDDQSHAERETVYLDRTDYAQLVRNLASAEVAAQFLDVILAAPESESGDRELAEALAQSGSTYLGMALGLTSSSETRASGPLDATQQEILDRRRWHPRVRGDTEALLRASRRFMTFPAIADPARGHGFIDLFPDRDGTIRRVPLFARDGERMVASLPLLVMCDFLDVEMDDIRIEPGRHLTLPAARRPGTSQRRDIVIPIDPEGRMIVNFVGPWESLQAYPFKGIYEASDDRFVMEDLREELRGRIALVSWFSTGRADIGAVPTDIHYPLSGVWACAMNTILTGEFIREVGGWGMLFWVELPLIALLFLAATRLSTVRYVALAFGLALIYLIVVAVAFLGANVILHVAAPLFVLVLATPVVAAYQFHLESEARAKMKRELAVARDIQTGTLPKRMPQIEGYDLAGASVPADETGGDSFDVIPLGDGRLMLLLGDATGHGIGPALSVTQVRAMLRVAVRLGADLDQIMLHVNDQLSDDLSANRFITAFLGVADTRSHHVRHHSAGQGPLLHFHARTGECEWFGSSTRALGMFPKLKLGEARSLALEPGDILGLMTDGVYEQENASGEPFGEARVAAIVRRDQHLPMAELRDAIYRELAVFRGSVGQTDDVTVLLLRRLATGQRIFPRGGVVAECAKRGT